MVLVIALLVLVPLSVLRLTGSSRVIAASIRAHHQCARTGLDSVRRLGVKIVSGLPIASTSAAGLAYDQAQEVRHGLKDQQVFAATSAAHDPLRGTPARGSAHRPARQGRHRRLRRELRPGRGPGLGVLAAGRRRAQRRHQVAEQAGFSSRSAFLDVTDVRRHQLAGPLHAAVGAVDRQPAALRPAGRRATASP